MGQSTPRGGPNRIQEAKSTSGSPAISEKASNNSRTRPEPALGADRPRASSAFIRSSESSRSVSYTHLTLPTICSV
eukprot:7120123-Alexandrium_andersonii.AAC.1